jgi:hypothetical protein
VQSVSRWHAVAEGSAGGVGRVGDVSGSGSVCVVCGSVPVGVSVAVPPALPQPKHSEMKRQNGVRDARIGAA